MFCHVACKLKEVTGFGLLLRRESEIAPACSLASKITDPTMIAFAPASNTCHALSGFTPLSTSIHGLILRFVEQPTKKAIGSATRERIDRLLLEWISLAGIARAAQVSEQWLQTYV
jgi:hypothetical protein